MSSAAEIMEQTEVSGMLKISPESLREHNERVQQAKDQKRVKFIRELKARWGAPARQVAAVVRREGEWLAKLQALETRLDSKRGILVGLVGGRGNGKTQMAVELMRHTVNKMLAARFITAIGFFMEIKATYRRESDKTEKAVMDEFCAPQLLVLDEISKRSDSNWENDLLFELLNRRYNDQKDTILISNQPQAELEAFLGASIVSRMNETGGFVPCTWPTFRE